MNLSEIRKAYPQYDDVPDDQLLDGMHAKYYSDIPKDEFFAAVNPPKERGVLGYAKDTAIDLAKGVVGFGESVVGIGDIVSGGAIGKGLQSIGYEPKQTQEFLSGFQSDARKKAEGNVQDAKGFVDTAVALGTNPSVLLGNIVQSLPGTIGAGAVGGLFVKKLATTALAEAGTLGLTGEAASAFVANKVKEQTLKIAAVASGAEGAQTAGSIAEAGRQAGSDWSTYVAPALAAGLGTAAIGIASGKVASKFGIGDTETQIAAKMAGVDGVGAGTQSFAKRVPLEMFKEGVLEEMPQSAQEQAFQNLATNRPYDEGVSEAAAQGLMAGAGMAGGHAAISGGRQGATPSSQAPEARQEATTQEALQIPYQPDPLISFPDGSVGKQKDVDNYINSLPEDQRAAARAGLLGLAPQPLNNNDIGQANLSAYSRLSTPKDIGVAGDYAQQLKEQTGRDYTVIPHAAGGYTVAPTAKLSPEAVAQFQDYQPNTVAAISRAKSVDEAIARAESVIKTTSFNVDNAVDQLANAAGMPEQQPQAQSIITPNQANTAPAIDTQSAIDREIAAYREAARKSVTGEDMTPAERVLARMPAPEGAIPKIALPNEVSQNDASSNAIELPVQYGGARRTQDTSQAVRGAEAGGQAIAQPDPIGSPNTEAIAPATGASVPSSSGSVVEQPALTPLQKEVARVKESKRDSITVWRGTKDTDAWLTLKRGDYVSALRGKTHGVIEGISNAKREVKIRGQWHDIGTVYPADRPVEIKPKTEQLSKTIASNNKKTGGDLSDADRVPQAEIAPEDTRVVEESKVKQEVRAVKAKTAGLRAQERLKAENPFLAMLAKHGVNILDRSDVGGEKGRKGMVLIPGHGPLFRKNGLRLDELASLAQEYGFLTQAQMDSEFDNGGVNAVSELIRKAINKEVVTRGDDTGTSNDDRLFNEAAAIGVNTNGMTIDQVYDAVKAHHDNADELRMQQEFDQARELLEGLNQEEYELEKERNLSNLEDYFNGYRQAEGVKSGTSDGEAIAESTGKTESAGGGETFSLTGQTESEGKAALEETARKEKATRDEKSRLDELARKEGIQKEIASRQAASAENFQLGQSAEDSLAGQGDIFAQPETKESPAAKAEAILDAANIKGKERLDTLKDVKSGALTVDEVARAHPSQDAMTLADYDKTMKAIHAGEMSIDDVKAAYQNLKDSEAAIKQEMNGKKKHELLKAGGGAFYFRNKNEKKSDIIDGLFSGMANDFAYLKTDSITYAMGDKTNAVDKIVDSITQEDLDKHVAKFNAEIEAVETRVNERKEGIANPKSAEDYRAIMRQKMEGGLTFTQARMELTPEQRAEYDRMEAEKSRSERISKKDEAKAEIRTSGQVVDGEIIETKHTKKGHDLFVVKLSERVSREDYDTLNTAAKKMGGYYSSFRGNGAIAGFQFPDKATAEAFVQLAQGDKAAAQDAVNARRDAFADDRSQSAVERLTEMADALEEKSDGELNRDRKTNTTRRAGMANRAEESARSNKAMAQTMRNIASAISGGSVKFLDKVRQKTQVQLLQTITHNAHNDIALEKSRAGEGRYENLVSAPIAQSSASHATWPQYTAYRSDLANLGRQLSEVDGTKKLGQQILNVADDVTDAYVKFAKENLGKVMAFSVNGGSIAILPSKTIAESAIVRGGFKGKAIAMPIKRGEVAVILSPSEAQRLGIWKGDDDKKITLRPEFGAELVEKIGKVARRGAKISIPWQFEATYDRRKALARMGIETPFELRAAIHEFIGLRDAPKEADKVKQLERAMVGRQNDGLDFFPTPASTVDAMIDAADIQDGMKVLEPSAGWGHIAERIRDAGVEPEVVELSSKRKELLEAKGFNVVGGDFMEVTEGDYDRIIMNPPFSDRRDIAHVQHAYSLLKPGGRLVAIMGEGTFFGKDKKAQEFREWLDSVNGTDEKLEEGTFLDPSLPVNTGTNARMVVVDKQDGKDILKSESPYISGVNAEEVSNAITLLRAKWVGFTKVNVVQSVNDLPSNIKDRIQADAQTEGFYDPQTKAVYLIADNIASPERAAWVASHEVIGHGGIRMLRDKTINEALDMAGKNQFISDLAKSIRQDRSDISENISVEEAIAEYAAAIETGDYQSIADRYQIDVPTSAKTGIKGAVSRVIEAIKRFLGVMSRGEVSNADVLDLINAQRAAVEYGGEERSLTGDFVLQSTKADQTNTPAFRKWFGDSKVVDADGNPLPVYHGTNKNIDTFNTEGKVRATFFSSSGKLASQYAKEKSQRDGLNGIVYPVYLKISNPMIVDANGSSWDYIAVGGIENNDKELRSLEKRGVAHITTNIATQIAEKSGFDGVIIKNVIDGYGYNKDAPKSVVYSVFAANQIKSATGNNGQFDANNSDIRYSKSTVGGAYEMMRDAKTLSDVTDGLKGALSSTGTMSLWDRTIGTQFNKSKKDADFKRVFDAYNQQTDDTAHYAIEAEKEAPTILQRLDSLKDVGKAIFKSGTKQKADIDAVSTALFANIEGKRGVQQKVFTDAELRSEFNLSEPQIEMYRQVRKSVDTSIDRLAQTYIASMGQAAGIDIADLKNLSLSDTAKAVKDGTDDGSIGKNIGGLTKNDDLHERIDEILEKSASLKQAGYMPAMRFGQYAVTVTDPSSPNEPMHFEMFESQTAANLAAMKLGREYPSMQVERSIMNPDQYAMFKGVSPETVELFAKFSGQDQSEAFKDYIALAKSGRSTMKRMLERKGIAGFSNDITRVLASFVTSNARQSAMNMNNAEINSAMASKSLAKKGDVQREAQKLHEYMANPREEAQALRGFMFMHFLGGSVASAAVNLTQPVLQTAPYLSQFAGMKTAKIMASAAKMAVNGDIQNAELKQAYARAEADGITEPHEIHHLMADATGSTLGNSLRARALTKAWGSFFSLSEAFNRRLTFLAAYQTAQGMSQSELKAAGFNDAYKFAANAIIETQGLYAKTNRPNWARGAVGATLFTFKQFSISYVEFLSRLPVQQKALALGILVLAAGLQY